MHVSVPVQNSTHRAYVTHGQTDTQTYHIHTGVFIHGIHSMAVG